MNTTVTRTLQFKVEWNERGSLVLTQDHFHLERIFFGHIQQCPKTFDEFSDCYRGMAFFSCSVLAEERLVAFKIVEKITPVQYHSFLTAVDPDYRRMGVARQMSSALLPHMAAAGAQFLTKFCVPDAAELEFEDAKFTLLSKGSRLTDEELGLLQSIKTQWQSSRIEMSRVQREYYTLSGKEKDDAVFKAYRLSDGS